MNLADTIAADARLMILKELAKQVDGRLSDVLVQRVLDVYGIRRNRNWVRTQLRELEALGAIELQEAGDILIARLAGAGRDHIEERGLIEGVTRPHEA